MYLINNKQNNKRLKPDSSSGLDLDIVATSIGIQRPQTGKLRDSRNQLDFTYLSEVQDYNCSPIQLATYNKALTKDKITNNKNDNLMVVGQQDRPKERIHMHSLGLQVMNTRDQS